VDAGSFSRAASVIDALWRSRREQGWGRMRFNRRWTRAGYATGAQWRCPGAQAFRREGTPYISGDKKLMSVSIDTSHGKLVAGVPRMLFQTRIIVPRIVLFQYAVAPDGKRCLINSLPPVGATPLTMSTN
jgi:hypothetical protein